MQLIRRARTITRLDHINIEIYNKIRGDDKKLQALGQIIDDVENVEWKSYEDSFDNAIVPKLHEIESILNAHHDFGQRRVQRNLKDVKVLVRKILNADVIPSDVRHYIDNWMSSWPFWSLFTIALIRIHTVQR